MSKQNKYKGNIPATVQTGGTCMPIVTGFRTKYNCQVTVQYQVGGQTFVTPILIQSDRDLSKGGTIRISYNPLNYQDIQPASTTHWRVVGWLSIIISVLIILFAWIGYWIIQKVDISRTVEKLREYWNVLR